MVAGLLHGTGRRRAGMWTALVVGAAALGMSGMAHAGSVFIDFASGVGPLTFKASGSGDLVASGGRAEFTGDNVTLLEDSGSPQTSTGTVTASMILHPSVDAVNNVGLIIADANDGSVFATALASSDGLVTLTDWIGNFRNVQFFAPNATNNEMILQYDSFTERATLTINPGTSDEDSAFLEVALNGAQSVSVGVASNGPGGFESFAAQGSGLADFPDGDPDPDPTGPEVTATFGQGFAEEGETLTLGASISGATPPVAYQWMKDGNPVLADPPRVSGTTGPNLTIDGVVPGDEGTYQLEFSDASKGGPFLSPPINVAVAPAGSLPLGGPAVLAITALALVLLAARRLGRSAAGR